MAPPMLSAMLLNGHATGGLDSPPCDGVGNGCKPTTTTPTAAAAATLTTKNGRHHGSNGRNSFRDFLDTGRELIRGRSPMRETGSSFVNLSLVAEDEIRMSIREGLPTTPTATGAPSRGRSPYRTDTLATPPRETGRLSPLRDVVARRPERKEAKLVVMGADGVGKSALIVRYLTKRFIHDYDPVLESLHSYSSEIDGKPVNLSILDTVGLGFPSEKWDEQIRWADGFILVYSVCARSSYDELQRMRDHVAAVRQEQQFPLLVVANMIDLVHMREVALEDGNAIARRFKCLHFEVAASEDIEKVSVVFDNAYRAVKNWQKRLEKMRSAEVSPPKERSRLMLALGRLKRDRSPDPFRSRTYTV